MLAGVSCAGDAVHVHRFLGLRLNQLSGSLPNGLAKLKALTFLSLSYNSGLTGSLPDNFTALTNLQYALSGRCSAHVSLTCGRRVAVIAVVAVCGSCRTISLRFNALTGTIPSGIGAMKGLQYVSILDGSFVRFRGKCWCGALASCLLFLRCCAAVVVNPIRWLAY